MSWSASIPSTPVKGFPAAVDKATVSGDINKGNAGVQITQVKAILTALANSGALGTGNIAASIGGHGEAPNTTLSISIWEVADETLPVVSHADLPQAPAQAAQPPQPYRVSGPTSPLIGETVPPAGSASQPPTGKPVQSTTPANVMGEATLPSDTNKAGTPYGPPDLAGTKPGTAEPTQPGPAQTPGAVGGNLQPTSAVENAGVPNRPQKPPAPTTVPTIPAPEDEDEVVS